SSQKSAIAYTILRNACQGYPDTAITSYNKAATTRVLKFHGSKSIKLTDAFFCWCMTRIIWSPAVKSLAKSLTSKQLGQSVRRAKGLTPEMLMKAGILRDTNQPAQALAKARAFLQQGRYADARIFASPHLNTQDRASAAMFAELLGECALRDGKADARQLLDLALQRFNTLGDRFGMARVQQRV